MKSPKKPKLKKLPGVSGNYAKLPKLWPKYKARPVIAAHCNQRIAWLIYPKDIPAMVEAMARRMANGTDRDWLRIHATSRDFFRNAARACLNAIGVEETQ